MSKLSNVKKLGVFAFSALTSAIVCASPSTPLVSDVSVLSSSLAPAPSASDLSSLVNEHFGKDMPIFNVTKDPLSGLYLIRLTDGSLMYTNEKADFLIASPRGKQPQLYSYIPELKDNNVINTTMALSSSLNMSIMNNVKDVIEIKAPNEKYIVTAFIDSACHYCKTMNDNIDSYTKAGITIRYVPFPIFGPASADALARIMALPVEQRASKLTEIERYFAENQGKPLDAKALGLSELTPASKEAVMNGRKFGLQLGISGTPGLVFQDGDVESRYMTADEIIKKLNGKK